MPFRVCLDFCFTWNGLNFWHIALLVRTLARLQELCLESATVLTYKLTNCITGFIRRVTKSFMSLVAYGSKPAEPKIGLNDYVSSSILKYSFNKFAYQNFLICNDYNNYSVVLLDCLV